MSPAMFSPPPPPKKKADNSKGFQVINDHRPIVQTELLRKSVLLAMYIGPITKTELTSDICI